MFGWAFFGNWWKFVGGYNTPVMRDGLELGSMFIGTHFRRSLPAARRRLADGLRIGGATPNYPFTPHWQRGFTLTQPSPIKGGGACDKLRMILRRAQDERKILAMTAGDDPSTGSG